MSVNSYACSCSVCIVQDNVCGFACNSWKLNQLLHSFWNLRMKFFYKELTAFLKVFGFVMVKTSGMNNLLQLLYICIGVVFSSMVFFEQVFCYYVDCYVGCLS